MRLSTVRFQLSGRLPWSHGPSMPGRLCGLLIALALSPLLVQAQSVSSFDEVGRFYMQDFGPEIYDAHAQNWAVVQNLDGLLYVGNGDGVLEYDGVSWRLIPVPNRSAVRALAVDAEGRVFVGAVGEVGYLASDSLGRMRYVSLVEHIPAGDRAFTNVWRIEQTSDGLYFRTNERLFRWNGREMKIWRPETEFFQIFVIHDTFYVQQAGIGLMRMENDSLGMAPAGDLFRGERVYGMVPQGEEAYLVITRDRGLFRCPTRQRTEAACTAFSPGLADLLPALRPYHVTMLPEGIAVGTTRGGVVLLDKAGRLLRILNQSSGLRDESVRFTYVDRRGGLWLALNNGLARIEADALLSYYDKTSGLLGSVAQVTRHQGHLYAATSLGIYRLAPAAAGAAPRFLPYPDITQQCWSLLSTPQGLLAGCQRGLYSINEQQLSGPLRENVVYEVYRSRRDTTLLYLGLYEGLARMRLRAGRWIDAGRVEGVREQVRSIVEDAQGRLWLGTRNNGVVRLEAAAAPSDDRVVRRSGVADGLPAGSINVKTVAGRVTFLSGEGAGLFRMDVRADSINFVPDTTFDAFLPQGSRGIEELTEDDRGRVWIAAGAASGVAHPAAEGGYTWTPTALRQAPTRDIYTLHLEADGLLWLGGPHGLIRYDTNRSLNVATSYPVWIRRLTTSNDSLLFDGRTARPLEAPAWPYRANALRFAFAAPRYDAPERIRYRARLDGFDDDWSAWANETDKDYTNLWEGRYVFRVQARDVYGLLSLEDSFVLRILPPWYRTWWAYTLYGLALVGVVLAYARSHRKELKRERQISRRLREVDKLKDEFLARTSHELRTPLYGITGLAESLIDGAAGELPETARANLAMIVGSGRRLGQLINDILDYSRLTHGSLELLRRPVDLRPLAEVVLALQRPLAAGKNLECSNAVPPDLPAVDADEARLEQILHNLVGNAVKFTEEGKVEISATTEEVQRLTAGGQANRSTEGGQERQLVVTVEDTGIGIAADKREWIFDAFEQADSGIQRAFGGTGLGLTVTRKLVELHGGRIWVESTVGQGSRFAFTLPASDQEAEPVPAPEQPVSRLLAVEPSATLSPVGEGTERTWSLAGRGPGNASILVVDDEPVNLEVLSNQLASEGYEVTLAASGAEAVRRLEGQAFDLVVLDVMMPRMSGYEVCRTLRERHSLEELPVIFLTAKNQVPDLVAGLAAGGNDYLAKPIGKDELLARVRTHLELLSVHRRLAAKNAELARFNYTVAHDLRNPLITIKNFLGVVRRDAGSGRTERLERDLDRLDSAADKLERMLDELFELSRVGVLANPPEEVPFGDLVHEARLELAGPIAERGVEVVVAEELPAVCGDRARLLEVVSHLLDNAVRYLGEQPAPLIEVGVRNSKAPGAEPPVFYVGDNGKGIDPMYHKKVFGLFERIDPDASEGTGIGLALVKRIVEVHGGRIWVESQGRGRGTTFFFTLPQALAVEKLDEPETADTMK